MKEKCINILEQVSDLLTVYSAMDEFEDLTQEEREMYNTLMLVYDLLSRTRMAQGVVVEQPDEMKEPGMEDDFVRKYGVAADTLADFAFNVATRQGEVDLRALLFKIMFGFKQKDIAAGVGIRANTISDYVTGKKNMTVGNYERIVNFTLKHNEKH